MADIRNFFGAGASKKRKSSAHDSKNPPKRALIQSDSEDDVVVPQKTVNKVKSPKVVKKERPSISASDFFGGSSPKRKSEKKQGGKENASSNHLPSSEKPSKPKTNDVQDICVKAEENVSTVPAGEPDVREEVNTGSKAKNKHDKKDSAEPKAEVKEKKKEKEVVVKKEKMEKSSPPPSMNGLASTPKRIKREDDTLHLDSPMSLINQMDDNGESTHSIFSANTKPQSFSRRDAYEAFMNREGPQALNTRIRPKGVANCLSGLTFVVTGVYDTLSREEIEQIVVEHGGRVTKCCSGKTTHLCLGRDGGISKTAKAKKLGVKLLTEDEFYFIITGKNPEPIPANDNEEGDIEMESDSETFNKYAVCEDNGGDNGGENGGEKGGEIEEEKSIKSPENGSEPTKELDNKGSREIKQVLNLRIDIVPPVEISLKPSLGSVASDNPPISEANEASCDYDRAEDTSTKKTPHEIKTAKMSSSQADSGMWADRYSPQSLKKLIGQSSPGSNANVLLKWIREFHTKFNDPKFNGDKKHMFKKAVLLSGPPGIGKTTMAQLVCKESGFNWIELNASDVRTKNKLKEHVAVCSANTAITGFYEASGKQKLRKDCILMDEVDGMSGNSDRGGIQELINIIKDTKVPIICMCNDRQAQSIRSLVKYTMDIRCSHPTLDQIKGAMRTVAFKEGLKIDSNAIENIIVSANFDMRQIWNNLSMWSASEKLSAEGIAKDAKSSKKVHKLGPFDATKNVFKKWKIKPGNLIDYESMDQKFDMFSSDTQLMPHFVQDNYLRSRIPGLSQSKRLLKAAEASDWLSQGDLTTTAIYSKQRFHLIPTQSFFSCVLPGQIMAGESCRIDFPRGLGHISSTNKHKGQYLDLHIHMAKSTTVSLRDLTLTIAPSLRSLLYAPLVATGADAVDDVIATMHSYNLSREDFDSLDSLAKLRISKEYHIATAVKSAFTRKFNKIDHKLPYFNTDLSSIAKPTKKTAAKPKAAKTSKPAKETKPRKKPAAKKK